MDKPRYCECGRRIVVRVNGKWKTPNDSQHDLCQRCWMELVDQMKCEAA